MFQYVLITGLDPSIFFAFNTWLDVLLNISEHKRKVNVIIIRAKASIKEINRGKVDKEYDLSQIYLFLWLLSIDL